MTKQVHDQRGYYTRSEILSQPAVWGQVLDTIRRRSDEILAFLGKSSQPNMLYTGCGSTYYLSLAAAATWREVTGNSAAGLPASEIWLNASSAYTVSQPHTFAAVSRSGTTTETIRAMETFRARDGGPIVTFTCVEGTPLSTGGDLNMVFPEAMEISVAQTRAFSSLYLATCAFAYLARDGVKGLNVFDDINKAGEKLLSAYAGLAQKYGSNKRFDRFYFLGSGVRYGLACEVSLKMKEMSLSHSEPFHFMEFRHGPMSMANESTLMVGFLSEDNRKREEQVLKEMRARGAEVITLASSDADVELGDLVKGSAVNVLFLPIIQLVAFEHSLDKGLNPDKPNNLTAVVKLDE